MASIGQASLTSLYSLFGNVQKKMEGAAALEAAAQKCVDSVYDTFGDSLALARLYATVPYGKLPSWNKSFVDGLAKAKGLSVFDNTPVLSLLATRGKKGPWNDRKKSEGHVGIPLASAAFVEQIPMVLRLLTDLGIKLEWIDKPDQGFSTRLADWSGLFHVPDAGTSKDQKNRHIIPAQDFVAEQGVKTVFGVGGSYASGTLFTLILFTTEAVDKPVAERFMPLVSTIKASTSDLATKGLVFA